MPLLPSAPLTLAPRTRKLIWLVLGLLLVVRLAAMAIVPLTDTTEARYGEIARKMAETNNWVTPLHNYEVDRATCEKIYCVELGLKNYGTPFWAKPPLSTWLGAISIKLFGASDFSVRLPSIFLGIGMMALTWSWIASRRNRDQALLTVTLLASTVLFFAAGGAVMTDSSLAICTTLTMIAFWRALQNEGRHWGYLFFVGLGIGLLAKGPLVGVLTFLPIVPWVILRGEWRRAWQQIPWFSGSALMLAISLPWYALAELKTPGFIEYFIVGEHINRFLHPGWTGDKYGHAHSEPTGTIWVYWLLSAFPFSLIAVGWLGKNVLRLRQLFTDEDGWALYLLLWVVMLLCFFTFAGNIIWPYVLPCLPAFACLAVELFRRRRTETTAWPARGFIAACGVIVVLGVAMSALYLAGQESVAKSSQRNLVNTWISLRDDSGDNKGEHSVSQLVYYRSKYQSAMFYTQGKVQFAGTEAELTTLLDNRSIDFIAVKTRDLERLTPSLRAHFRTVAQFENIALLQEQAVALQP